MTSAVSGAPGRLGRLALPLLLFLGLAALEVHHAVDGVRTERVRRERALLEALDRQHERLARTITDLLGEGASHARALGLNPSVRALLRAEDDVERMALERALLPYLSSFRGLDRITVLAADGRQVFRCERLGDGVAALPPALLPAGVDAELQALVEGAAPGEVVSSPLLHDAERVEVETSQRRVFHHATPVDERGRRLGAVAVTTYAAPLLEALSELDRQLETASVLFDAAGRPFAAAPAEARAAGGTAAAPTPAELASALARDPTPAGGHPGPRAILFVRPTGGSPPLHLATALGRDVLGGHVAADARLLPTLVRTLAVLLAITLASWVLWRALARNERLRETERFLERIRQESAKHRALMEAAADLILVVEPEGGRPVDWNQRAAQALGLGPGGRDLAELFEPDSDARLRGALATAAAQPGEPVVVLELALRRADGGTLDVDARCVAIREDDAHTVEVALSDRTREREMERRVQTAERLSSLGLLTAGVAHEINNPLAGIANYLRLLERTEDPERRARHLAAVRSGYERIRDIVGDLLSFARPGRESGAVDLGRVAQRAVSLARLSREGRGLEVEVLAPAAPVVVEGSEGRLEQVLLNLLLNAERAARTRVTVRLEATAHAAELAVEDDGDGIAEADLPHVFDPFFTRTEGTGLGLAVSYGIIRAHGGELVAANRPEGGARFVVRLPRPGDPPPSP